MVTVFFGTLFLWGNCGRCDVLLPHHGVGVSEAYESAGAAIQTEVWLKVVITPLLGAIVFALLDIGWQLKEALQDDLDTWKV